MNLTEKIIAKTRELDEAGRLHNLWDDFLWEYRDQPDQGAGFGSALLRIRRVAKGHTLGLDDEVVEVGWKFLNWLDARPSARSPS